MNYLPPQVAITGKDKCGIHFTDLHLPYQSHRAVKELKALIRSEKPDFVIDHGDVVDNREIHRFNANSIVEEFVQNKGKRMPDVWNEAIEEHDLIFDAAPNKARKIVLWGNHDIIINRAMEPYKHMLNVGYNPYLNCWRKSRHKNEIYHEYPNNEVLFSTVTGIKTEFPILLSHQGKSTSGNHGKATWVSDYDLGVSRIYGHAHDPNFWYGLYDLRRQARDKRFSWCMGALCDRSRHREFGYATRVPRIQWKPSVLLWRAKRSGSIEFTEIRFTPDPITYMEPVISTEIQCG